MLGVEWNNEWKRNKFGCARKQKLWNGIKWSEVILMAVQAARSASRRNLICCGKWNLFSKRRQPRKKWNQWKKWIDWMDWVERKRSKFKIGLFVSVIRFILTQSICRSLPAELNFFLFNKINFTCWPINENMNELSDECSHNFIINSLCLHFIHQFIHAIKILPALAQLKLNFNSLPASEIEFLLRCAVRFACRSFNFFIRCPHSEIELHLPLAPSFLISCASSFTPLHVFIP